MELATVVSIGCTKTCYHNGSCWGSYCVCHKERVGPSKACCDTCVGSLCLCPPEYQCNVLCPHAFTNRKHISPRKSPNIVS